MSGDALESAVARFLERRERDPELAPEDFARQEGAPEGLLDALRAALGAEAHLREGAAAAPRWVGPYRVLGVLGAGGMGVVLEVERDGERLALKRLHPALSGERARERFQREAELLRRLDHPGVVRVREVGSEDGEPYIAMELVAGASLARAAAGWPLERRLRAAVEVCEAVQAAHDRGLLHRDLKPGNVLVRRDGSCALVDFGLGAAEDDASLTSTGDLVGTPRTMAPEQARGERADVRTDVWGLGQVLYEVCVGRPAIEAPSRTEALRAVLRGAISRPRAWRPELPRDLERVILVALAHAPARRYASARELADDLRRVLAGEPVRARPPGALARGWIRARAEPARSVATLALALVVAGGAFFGWKQLEQHRAGASRRHAERAATLLAAGEVEAGVAEALAAARPGGGGPALSHAELARTLGRAPDQDAVRAALRAHLAQPDDRLAARFALAVSLDSDHRLSEAGEAYRQVLALQPDHAFALLYLGHLRAGADSARCEPCRIAFGAQPELLDRAEAGRLLAAALRADGGRRTDLVRTLVFLAREHDLVEPVLAVADDLLAAKPPPQVRARLVDARDGLQR